MLRNAHLIDSKEALNHLSLIRLGGNIGFFPAGTVNLCDTLLMDIQQAHLQLHAGAKLSPDHRDSIRAKIMRSRLQSLESPDIDRQQNDQTGRFPEGGNPENA